ncbi:MAG: Capsule assembly protein Wzi [Gemmatimonadetes bacterium]|nr:Capsule assembly protein Wzi [Gemmatimonadota bacterium]
MTTSRSALLLVLSALAVAAPASAQGTALVPLSDPAYFALDRLAELLPLAPYVVGQRPYSERELCRIARVARPAVPREMSEGERRIVEDLVRSLEARCATRALAGEAALVVASTDAPRRSLPGSFGSPTEATIGSIGERRPGTPLQRGQTVAAELALRGQPAAWLAIGASGRVEARGGHTTTSRGTHAELLSGGIRARRGNVALLVGREQTAWAQRRGDGFFLASDAPALDQVALSSDRPFILPGFLGRLGPARGTVLLADLGPSVVRSHSRLLAYKVSVQPTASLELGGTFLNHFGGQGSPSTTVADRVIDFLPFIDIFRRHAYDPVTLAQSVESDKVLGIDGRLRLPLLGGVTLAGEWLVDDFDVHKLPKLFGYLSSHSLAVIVPRVAFPAVSLALSAKHLGVLTSTHATLTNGSTTRGRLLGDELGPDSKAFAGMVQWTPSAATQVSVELGHAVHSNALYGATYTDSARTRYEYTTRARFPDETRDRVLGTARLSPLPRTSVIARVAGERVRNANFRGGRRRDYLVEIGVYLRP